jgi:hypothetical protein
MLNEIWPTKVSASWPPQFSFRNDGTVFATASRPPLFLWREHAEDIAFVLVRKAPAGRAKILHDGESKKNKLEMVSRM